MDPRLAPAPAPARAPRAPLLRLLTPGMRLMLYVAGGLVFTVGIQLFLLTEATDRYFAWTINPPLTAAFLGGAYWASCILEVLAARERLWARARMAVPAVLTFTTLTLVATLLHLNKFHLNSPALETRLATWSWIAVYSSVPLIMGSLLVQQMRAPGGDPARTAPVERVFQGLLVGLAIGLALSGLALFLIPEATLGIWPWLLTPLTARAIGAWLLGLAIAVGHAAWEADWGRIRSTMIALIVFGVFELVALARYPAVVQWGQAPAWIYVGTVVLILVLGLWGTIRAQAVPQGAGVAALGPGEEPGPVV
ncbi:MAG TPA: hypothetical protein VKY74_06470 [Chloroflexia bacterium]|nr:hypothetical protein [Chloroflexia bacterium]